VGPLSQSNHANTAMSVRTSGVVNNQKMINPHQNVTTVSSNNGSNRTLQTAQNLYQPQQAAQNQHAVNTAYQQPSS